VLAKKSCSVFNTFVVNAKNLIGELRDRTHVSAGLSRCGAWPTPSSTSVSTGQ